MRKTSIRFFEEIPVRAVWNDEDSKWWFCATDIAEALTKSRNPRVYWAQMKRRKPQLITICKQLKLTARDGKAYLDAMQRSTTDASDIFALIEGALTGKIHDRELFMKGIDYSYYYEEA